MIGHLRRTSAILVCLVALILAAGVRVPARAADNAASGRGKRRGGAGRGRRDRPAPPAVINTGDTAWLLLRRPRHVHDAGLALFYGGMVRRKNVLGTVVQSFIVLGLISVEWILVGTAWRSAPTWAESSGTCRGRALRRGTCAVQGLRGTVPHRRS